jgi:hypothetical protein
VTRAGVAFADIAHGPDAGCLAADPGSLAGACGLTPSRGPSFVERTHRKRPSPDPATRSVHRLPYRRPPPDVRPSLPGLASSAPPLSSPRRLAWMLALPEQPRQPPKAAERATDPFAIPQSTQRLPQILLLLIPVEVLRPENEDQGRPNRTHRPSPVAVTPMPGARGSQAPPDSAPAAAGLAAALSGTTLRVPPRVLALCPPCLRRRTPVARPASPVRPQGWGGRCPRPVLGDLAEAR